MLVPHPVLNLYEWNYFCIPLIMASAHYHIPRLDTCPFTSLYKMTYNVKVRPTS